MSRKHQSEPKDHPTHMTKDDRNPITSGEMDQANLDQVAREGRDQKLVDIGRGMQTTGRMKGGS